MTNTHFHDDPGHVMKNRAMSYEPDRAGGFRGVVLEALEDDGASRAVAREAEREGDVAIGHEHRIVHMKARVRPGEHRLRVLGLEQPTPHEEPQHGATKGFGQGRGVVRRPRHEGAVGAEAAVSAMSASSAWG
jgi:hypothetical protein